MRKALKNITKNITGRWLVLLFVFMMTACGEQNLQVATGDHGVLEQLATAFRKVGEMYPVQPQAMPPDGRKKFLNQVFTQAGYSYSASLIALASAATNSTNQDQRDLAELLLLPTKGLSENAVTKLYSEEELAAVKKLQVTFR